MVAVLAALVAPAQGAVVMKALSARSLAAAGVPDPMCKTGVISLKATGKPQSCCASYCGECTNYETCKSVRGQDSKNACCVQNILDLECGNGAAANVCLSSCTESVPPCIMPEGKTYTPSTGRNAAEDCNKAVSDWREKAKNALEK